MNYDNPSDRPESADDAPADNGDKSKPLWPDMPDPAVQPDVGNGYDNATVFGNSAASGDGEPVADTEQTTDLGGPATAAYQDQTVPVTPFADEPVLTEVAEVEPEKPGRDRLLIHLFLEAGLLVLAGVGAWLVHDRVWPVFDNFDNMSLAMGGLAPYLLLALAVGVSLRVGAPNLAVGPVAYLSIALVGPAADESNVGPLLLTAGVAVGAGVIVTVLVLVFRLPAWAVSLGVGLVALAWLVQWPGDGDDVTVFDVAVDEYYWLFAGAGLLAIAGGLIGLLPVVRERLSACREATTNGGAHSAATLFTTASALIGSMVLAATAGVAFQVFEGPIGNGRSTLPHHMLPDPINEANEVISSLTLIGPFDLTLIALAIALLGGTSLRGRRGGVLGTVLATIVLAVGAALWTEPDWEASLLWLLVAALGLGLIVSWTVDVFGAPKAADAPVEPSEPDIEALPNGAGQTTLATGSLFEPSSRTEPIDPFARQ